MTAHTLNPHRAPRVGRGRAIAAAWLAATTLALAAGPVAPGATPGAGPGTAVPAAAAAEGGWRMRDPKLCGLSIGLMVGSFFVGPVNPLAAGAAFAYGLGFASVSCT